jgi:hypothetical protein
MNNTNFKETEFLSEEEINFLETINENQMIINENSDDKFFSNKINCITFFGVLYNSRSSFFLKSNVINPFFVHNGELYACGRVMKKQF